MWTLCFDVNILVAKRLRSYSRHSCYKVRSWESCLTDLHGEGEGDDLVRRSSQSLPKWTAVLVLQEEMEDGGDLALREMGQEIFHRLVWELEGKLHYWLPERTSQLKSGREGGWSGR